ncbi:tetracycline resistance transcriptional repressor TetR(62) [Pseudochrobactrum asaccharolyticum]|uniref:tetracycline resistance transcriptional repressor TetR(62) n=1 Tax=Pseudochrobactrum asaccharolyticum TaxID=354351 RepID=UPI004041D370
MTKLDRQSVIRAALDLLNDVGADGLTTRKLAERLHVQQPALYWHFRNKRVLLDALAEAMLNENHSHSLPLEGEDWRHFLRNNGRSFRKALLSYRDGARIHAGTRPSAPHFATAEAQIRFLCQADFSAENAVRALSVIGHYTVGSVLEQQSAQEDAQERQEATTPSAEGASDFLLKILDHFGDDEAERSFDYGLDALIAGFEVLQRS